jgi:pimeloyl-ACP methyl ester carboxylesterase
MERVRIPLKIIVSRQVFRLLGMVAPAIAAKWAYRIWYSTRRFRESEHDSRWRKQAQLQMLDHEVGKIAVYRWGEDDKPVVLCVHGWNGRASQFATMVPALLKADYQVVAFDAPGHGLSEGNSTNIFRISAVLKTLADQYPSLQAIISHSFGGMVSAHAIKHHGISVQKLIMVASPVSTRYLIDLFAQSMYIDQRVMQRFDKMLRHEFGDDVYDKVSVEQNLKNTEIPILLVHDKQDTAVSWRNSERIAEVTSSAVVIYTEGHGHRRLLRDKKLIRKMVNFIKTGVVIT